MAAGVRKPLHPLRRSSFYMSHRKLCPVTSVTSRRSSEGGVPRETQARSSLKKVAIFYVTTNRHA